MSATAPTHHGATAPLLDLAPELAGRLDEGEHRAASRLCVPVRTAFDGPFDLDEVLRDTGAFAILIVDGMLLSEIRLGEHLGLRLLGPGDVVSRAGGARSELVERPDMQASGPVRYAPLDDRVLALAQRYPRVVEGLQMRNGDQQQRLLTQLLICQLPRVQDRVLGLMWLLAESWGRVTPSGTVLPMRLTHDAIGRLIGARRPTVTLALKQLERRGALVRRADDWLILERLPSPVPDDGEQVAPPRLVAPPPDQRWRAAVSTPADAPRAGIAQLHSRRVAALEESQAAVADSARAGRHSRELMARITLRRSVGRDGLHQQDHAGDLLASLPLRGPER